MGGHHRSTTNEVIKNYNNEDVINTTNTVKNQVNHQMETNTLTSIQNGDKSAGGAVELSNDVNMGTGIYKLNLMNLAPEHFAMKTPVKSTPETHHG
jgi:hypothetical protein